MNKILIKWAILVATVSGGISTGNMIGRAAATPDYQDYYVSTYQEGVNSKVINKQKVTFTMFQKQCNEEFSQVYVNYLKDGGEENFSQYMRDNYYGQDDPGASSKPAPVTTAISEPTASKYYHYRTKAVRKGYHMKAGDILICHNTNSMKSIPGHAAIVNSSGYIMEMPGTKHVGKKKNARIVTKKHFFKQHSGGSAYVMVYRIMHHPHIAKKAARYAYYKMLKHHNPEYSIFKGEQLYKKSPSYCSKYVYLAYDWGGTRKAMKQWWGGVHIVSPYGLVGNFKGSYKPTAIHRVIAYK
ncbi:hypothetical protein KQI03_11050 [Levilactobacillus brevis]|uniref:hypothetical protein n=1 Tax=Levilactobacillus brevis TaxID=1580 RepID=UPI000462EE52|nr:hypothetical protein [Levilactobacillus brevis]MBU5275160.1 hypothetical protein [Levilactobacillus brevis]QCZ46664.1 hypothetical protein UCCLB556_1783 [Levilactobacillus brevis]QCZ56280.1 hypothetical protein UCCLB521_1716 [Levilactobacillus brevis]